MIVSWLKLVVIKSYDVIRSYINLKKTAVVTPVWQANWLSPKLKVDLFTNLLEDKSWVLWTTIKLLIQCVTGWGMVGLLMRRRHLLLGNRWRKLAPVSCATRMSQDATHSLQVSWTCQGLLNRPSIVMITNSQKFFILFWISYENVNG